MTPHELRTEPLPSLFTLLIVSLVAFALASGLRYGLMESSSAVAACAGAVPPWWCGLRSTLGLLIHYQAFGWAALLLGLFAWIAKGRAVVWLALVIAVVGVVLYNTSLAVVGLVAALLRAVRP